MELLWVYAIILTLVVCVEAQETGDIRLYRGTSTSGIVQLYDASKWTTLCGLNFKEKEASVACRQLGFSSGTALPLSAYGKFADAVAYPDILQECPTGQEVKLTGCSYDEQTACAQIELAYASVNCFNGQPAVPGSTIRLDNGDTQDAGYFSAISVYKHNMWGHVCSEFWDREDANVTCKQLGFAGGVATLAQSDQTIPILISKITCQGLEQSLDECESTSELCSTDRVAGVICNRNQGQAATISLVGGKEHYGKVVISIDGKQGLFCGLNQAEWYISNANAVCKTLGFIGGFSYLTGNPDKEREEDFYHSIDTTGIDSVVIEGLTCDNDAVSILDCPNNGWMNVSQTCQNTSLAAGVWCYSTVRMTRYLRLETNAEHTGRPEMKVGSLFLGICAEVFTQTAANIACQHDLGGFPIAEILLPGSYGDMSVRTSYVNSLACMGNETSLQECTYTMGWCKNHSRAAALLCKVQNLPNDYQFILKGDYYGEITMTRFGLTGTICRSGWDDNDATVACRASGYVGGIVLAGSLPYGTRLFPEWASDFACNGSEISLNECQFQTDLATNWVCSDDRIAAGVLCYLKEPPAKRIRLADSKSSSASDGRAEVYNDVTGWGTICNIGWSVSDAKVFCRELGFADGQPDSNSFLRNAASDVKVLLSDMRCDGTESSIFHCQNLGWQVASSACQGHTKDAGVYCYTYVTLSPSSNYGAVQYHSGESYGLVCADDFDEKAAKVVCKEVGSVFGFIFGKPLCCSAFGPQNLDFTLSGVSCTGFESSLTDCQYNNKNPTCPSGQYASVVCTYYEGSFTKVVASPIVQITYYTHEGLVCSENFTHKDATVVCKQTGGFTYGRAFRASAIGRENVIRWLRGLGCQGSETSIMDCGPHNWGQIGICSWSSVAAVICSNNQDDMDFDVRLVNGTSVAGGRLEVKIKGIWGTVCGKDVTKTVATVVCKQLGYHDGIVKEPGHYGGATGAIHLSGIKCEGTESSIEDCVWSGYGVPSTSCDHSFDAAIFCEDRVRLSGSTTVNYGRLEVYDDGENDWVSVCDRNINVNNAIIICRQLGYMSGMFQRGSPLGPASSKVAINAINCDDPTKCIFSTGSCLSNKYVALYCSETTINLENFDIRLPLSSYYGPVSVRRFGLWGHICSVGFDDIDAIVVCSQLGYSSGYALKTYATTGFPIIQGYIACNEADVTLVDCDRRSFAEDHGCYSTDTVAAVMCYNEQVAFGSTDLDHVTGRMISQVQVIADDHSFYVGSAKFTNTDAAVYCSNLDYAGGEVNSAAYGAYGVNEIECEGTEENILQCPGEWDPSKKSSGDLARVTCYTAVRLEGGNPKSYGAVFTSKGVNNGPVCASGFDDKDAGVACRNLGHDSGLVLCCAPVGDIVGKPVMTNVQCTGSEKQFIDCVHDTPDLAEACSKNYAAVACYSGQKPTEYELSLAQPEAYTGNLVMAYLGINGSICMDGWDGNDAQVACRELGYTRGMAYHAARSTTGPYWTSDVQCSGSENKLANCQKTELGTVTECTNVLSHAGVICYDNEGLFYRLEGSGEPRYGHVVITLNGEWLSLCNLYWESPDAHVLCTMLGFRTGEVYNRAFNDSLTGPVWEAHFQCDGTEATLNDCVSSGWRISTTSACAQHQKDAGAFCYTSVKLSTGVGRDTDQGAVLFYRNGDWYTVCGEDFNDTAAKVVCQELGFIDGQAQSGASYGQISEYPLLNTHKVQCSGEETDVTDCLVEETCNSEGYAAVVCYGFLIQNTESPKQPVSKKDFDAVPVIVAVLVFVVLVIVVATIVFIFLRRRRQRKLEESKLNFDNTIVSENGGGTMATNPLAGMVHTPDVPRAQYTNRNGHEATSLSPMYVNPHYTSLERNEGDVEGSYAYANPQKPGTSISNNTSEVPVLSSFRQVDTNPYDVPASSRSINPYNVPTAANKTVIQVNSNPYDNSVASKVANKRNDLQESKGHEYDNIEELELQNEKGDKPRVKGEDDGVKREDTTDGPYYMTLLADQQELSSPKSSVMEPAWPKSVD